MIFDGHNDVLMLVAAEGGVERFVQGAPDWAIDLPGLEASAMAGGLFAAFPDGIGDMTRRPVDGAGDAWLVDEQPPLDPAEALARTREMLDAAHALVAAAPDRLVIARDLATLERELGGPRRVMVLHLEGAEAVVDDAALDELAGRGVRSIGLVWSRANRFAHGVRFGHPASPDAGPGLTAAGRDLVARCRALGILVDLAHLNAAGFWDVAQLDDAPLVVSHTAAHALCPSARNLTDDQLDAVGASRGLVGLNLFVGDLRPDGRVDANTSLDTAVDHIVHIADRIGIDHIALGSDYCGATVPSTLTRVENYNKLLDRLTTRGFSTTERTALASGNWLRILRDAWRPR